MKTAYACQDQRLVLQCPRDLVIKVRILTEARPPMPKGPRHQGAYINRGSSSNAQGTLVIKVRILTEARPSMPKGPRHQGA
jgi:hypothetical protein